MNNLANHHVATSQIIVLDSTEDPMELFKLITSSVRPIAIISVRMPTSELRKRKSLHQQVSIVVIIIMPSRARQTIFPAD